MYHDVFILISLILSSVLIALIAFSFSPLKSIYSANTSSRDKKFKIKIDKTELMLRIILFIIVLNIICRLVFIVAFSAEINNYDLTTSFFSLPFIFMVEQTVVFSVFMMFAAVLLLYFRLKLENRFKYLRNVLIVLLLFVIIDLISVGYLYIKTGAVLLIPHDAEFTTSDTFDVSSHGRAYLLLTFGIVIFILLAYNLHNQRNFINSILQAFSYISTIIFAAYLTIISISYFFEGQTYLYSALSFINYDLGFLGLVWLFIFLSGVSCQMYNIVLLKRKKNFISEQYCLNYFVHLNRISLVSFFGVCIIAFFPLILNTIIK